MYRLAPNIELMFTDAGPDPADRIRAAAAAGFDAVEMWDTLRKDVPMLAKVLQDNGVAVTTTVAMPYCNFTFPGTDLSSFFEGFERSVEHAQILGSPRIVVTAGPGFPGADRRRNMELLADAMRQAVDRSEGSGVTLIVEAVNTLIDHPGALLDRTSAAVDLARAVGSPRLKILYDLYHSIVSGEDPQTELADAAGYVDYIQVADLPGRGQPGSGDMDWPGFLTALRGSGYDGPIGLELYPNGSTLQDLDYFRSLAARV